MKDVPPVIHAWIAQLLDPQTIALVEASEEGQIDIRLAASRGKVRRLPEITFNKGVTEHVEPASFM